MQNLWRELGLTLSLKASRMNLRAVEFFGMVSSREGISLDTDNVAALKTARPPPPINQSRYASFSLLEEVTTLWRDLNKEPHPWEGFPVDTGAPMVI